MIQPLTNCNTILTVSGTEKCALPHIKGLGESRKGKNLFVTFIG